MRLSPRWLSAALIVLATAAARPPAAHAWSCYTFQGDMAVSSSVAPGCDLVFLSEYGDYAIEELVMEVWLDGVSMSVPFEGERRTTTIATDYGSCNSSTCEYDEWTSEQEFGLYVLSPLMTLPDGAIVTISHDLPGGGTLVSFDISESFGSCYDAAYPPRGSCYDRPCGMPPYTPECSDGIGGCSASSSPAGWPLGASLALLALGGARWQRRRARRA